MKTLFIMRHGQAEPRAASDSERTLTQRGEADVHQMITSLTDELVGLEHVWTSPYRRARQTAAIVNEVLDRGAEPVLTDLLVPEAGVEPLCEQIQTCQESSLMLVSHMPLVGELLHYLTGAEPGRYSMGTSSVACVAVDVVAAGLGQLRWLHHREG
ncbi:phosphohistidine phosphatase SixA [Marinimicrobium locisalis]|uniref:phosphohistidine phosphatase SixA n=1 Tax=Marinimicrobium locisalis TaxID=546022 RepID=UPI003221DF5A